MDVLSLIDEIEDIIEAASGIPFSGKVMIDKDEVLDIIQDLRIKLPDEIKQAAWIKNERQRILTEAQRDAEMLMQDAEMKLEDLIDKEQITRKAKERGEEIINKAQISAKEIRLGSLEYADNILEQQQESLKEMIKTINENRKELRGD